MADLRDHRKKRLGVKAGQRGAGLASMIIPLVSNNEMSVFTTETRITRKSHMPGTCVIESIWSAHTLLSSDLDIAGGTFATGIDILL
jgi:hypothetical protein